MLPVWTGSLERTGRGGNNMASMLSLMAAVTGVVGLAVPVVKLGVDLVFRVIG
jgi:hypothetical protein